MEAHIRFCTSADGIRIGYAIRGAGRPLITVNPWGSSLEKTPHPLGYSASHRDSMVVVFDRRGNGVSQREVEGFTLEAQAGDIEAVANELKLESFDLVGDFDGGAIAAAFASYHPRRVRRLALSAPYAHGGEIGGLESMSGLIALVRSNWQLGRRALADIVFPRGPVEAQIGFADLLRQAMTAEVAAHHLEFQSTVDIRPCLPKIQAPTLVLHGTRERRAPIAAGRNVALMIPDARFAPLEGSTWERSGYVDLANAVIHEFLKDTSEQLPYQQSIHPGMTAILFADIADSTGLTERLGDATFRSKSRDLDAALRTLIREHTGTPIEGKLLGDGVLAVFTSARQAIEAALACAEAGAEASLPLHLGLHAGDVIREDNNVYGGAVNIASRISGLSAPGEVLVSDTVRSLARTSAGVMFEDRGEQALKGVGELVRVWAVQEAE